MANKINFFYKGDTPSFAEVLDAREERAQVINHFSKQYQTASILVLTCALPGPVKRNPVVDRLMREGKSRLLAICAKNEWTVEAQKDYGSAAGPSSLFAIRIHASELKRAAIELEESSAAMRLLDFDVHIGAGATLKRTSFGFPPRTCYVCSCTAKECARNRTHSLQEVLEAMSERIEKDGSVINCGEKS